MDKNDYVIRLMKAECSMGSMSNYLNLKRDHGIVYSSDKQPVLNAIDYKEREHIVHFGRCKSKKNPENSLLFFPSIFSLGSKLIKKLLGCDGCKCKPLTITPWIQVSDTHYIDGVPAITLQSQLACVYGGIITITVEKNVEDTAIE